MLIYGSAVSISVVDNAWPVLMENIPNPMFQSLCQNQ